MWLGLLLTHNIIFELNFQVGNTFLDACIPCDLVIPILGIFQTARCSYVHEKTYMRWSIFCSKQKLETIKMPVNGKVDKLCYIHNWMQCNNYNQPITVMLNRVDDINVSQT